MTKEKAALARDFIGFLSAVDEEIVKARANHPGNALRLAALVEEVGELAQAMLHRRAGKATDLDVYWEAVQVAAMAARIAVEGDASFDAVPYSEPEGRRMSHDERVRRDVDAMRREARRRAAVDRLVDEEGDRHG